MARGAHYKKVLGVILTKRKQDLSTGKQGLISYLLFERISDVQAIRYWTSSDSNLAKATSNPISTPNRTSIRSAV